MRLQDFETRNTAYQSNDFIYAVPISIKGNTMPTAGDLKVDYAMICIDSHVLGNASIQHCIKDLCDGLQSAFIRATGTIAAYGQTLTDALDKIDECPIVTIHGPMLDAVLLDVEFMLDGNVIAVDLDTAEVSSTDYKIGRSMAV